MRKQFTLVAVLTLLCLFGTKATATQTLSLTKYAYERTTSGVEAHTFSASAVTFNFSAGTNLSQLWLKSDGTFDTLAIIEQNTKTTTPHTGNIAFTMPFGSKDIKYLGVTGGGVVYFGEADTLYPVANPEVQMVWAVKDNPDNLVRDLAYLQLVGHKLHWQGYPENQGARTLYATENTRIQFEKVGDSLFYAGYENVKIYDIVNSQSMTVSFQIEVTSAGHVAFLPTKDMPNNNSTNTSTGKGCFGFSYGIYAHSIDNCLFIGAKNYGYEDYELTCYDLSGLYYITSSAYPKAGEKYALVRPGPCEAVANPYMNNWDYTVSSTTLTFGAPNNAMSWNEGDEALVILSPLSELTGDNLPQNGTVYKYGDTIGQSLYVNIFRWFEATGLYTSLISIGTDTVNNLSPNTTYYLYVYPYYTACPGGPIYNTLKPLRDTLVTYPVRPESLSVIDSTIDYTSLTIKVNTENPYLLAYTTRQVSDEKPFSPERRAYTQGEVFQIPFIYLSHVGAGYDTLRFDATVIEPNTQAGTHKITGLTPGTDYYFYAWTVNEKNGNYVYSDYFATAGVSTLRNVPAVLDFSSATPNSNNNNTNPAPAGWSYGADNTGSIVTYQTENRRHLVMPLMATTTGATSKFSMVSPYLCRNKNYKVFATLELDFWTSSESVEYSRTKPQATDNFTVEFRNYGSDTWQPVSVLTGKDVTSSGAFTYETDAFAPGDRFQLRITVRSNYNPGSGAAPYVSLYSVKMDPSLECAPVESLSAPASGLTSDKALITWEDGNISQSAGYILSYRHADSAQWQNTVYVTQAQHEITGLKSLTPYAVAVRTVCAAGDSSITRDIALTTLGSIPYTLAVENNRLPSGISLKTGVLPAEEDANLRNAQNKLNWQAVSLEENDSVWQGLGLTDIANATVETPLWLLFPTLYAGEQKGSLKIDVDILGWSSLVGSASETREAPEFDESDELKILVSSDGVFNAAKVVGTIKLSQLSLSAKSYSFAVSINEPMIYVAIYTDIQLPVTEGEGSRLNSLFIPSVSLDWGEIVCEPVKNLRQYNLGKTGIDISWKGESLEYAVAYKPRSENEYDTLFTENTSCTLSGLTPGTSYEYKVWGYCESGRRNPGEASATKYFRTIEECIVPTIQVTDTTWSSIQIAMGPESGHTQQRIVEIFSKDRQYTYKFSTQRDTVRITGLYMFGIELTYDIHCRAVCSDNDSSDWSEFVTAATAPVPPCGSPSHLAATVNKAEQTATLTWSNGINNEYQMLEIRDASRSRFDTSYSESEQYIVYNLKLNTTYYWRLTPFCEDILIGNTVSSSFGTESVAVEAATGFENAFTVRIANSQIIIRNIGGMFVKSVDVFSLDGRLQRSFAVNSTDNVMVYHNLNPGMALVRIIGEKGQTATYKVMVL